MKEEEENQIVESAVNLPKKRCNLNDYAVPLTLNVGMLPTKSDVNKKWSDRCNTYYNFVSSFSYEVVYPSFVHVNCPQPLSLKPYIVKSSIGSNESIECCVVSDQMNFNYYQQVVHPGDIVLKVNDINIFGVYNYEKSLEKVLDINIARTIKFFRPSSLTPNLLPSIAELKLHMEEKSITAKFSLSFNSTLNSYSYEMLSHDANVSHYPALTKILKRQRVQWEVIPGQSDKILPLSGLETYSSGNTGKWVPYGKLRRGIYADRERYIAVGDIPHTHVGTDNIIMRRFYLGRYANEEVAMVEFDKDRVLKLVNNCYKLEKVEQPQIQIPIPNINQFIQPNPNMNTIVNSSTVNE